MQGWRFHGSRQPGGGTPWARHHFHAVYSMEMLMETIVLASAALLALASPALAGKSTPQEREATKQLNLEQAQQAKSTTQQIAAAAKADTKSQGAAPEAQATAPVASAPAAEAQATTPVESAPAAEPQATAPVQSATPAEQSKAPAAAENPAGDAAASPQAQ